MQSLVKICEDGKQRIDMARFWKSAYYRSLLAWRGRQVVPPRKKWQQLKVADTKAYPGKILQEL